MYHKLFFICALCALLFSCGRLEEESVCAPCTAVVDGIKIEEGASPQVSIARDYIGDVFSDDGLCVKIHPCNPDMPFAATLYTITPQKEVSVMDFFIDCHFDYTARGEYISIRQLLKTDSGSSWETLVFEQNYLSLQDVKIEDTLPLSKNLDHVEVRIYHVGDCTAKLKIHIR